jgi:hypothetical protein
LPALRPSRNRHPDSSAPLLRAYASRGVEARGPLRPSNANLRFLCEPHARVLVGQILRIS